MDIPSELRRSGLKATLPRLRILRLFQESGTKHLTADDVFRVLHAERIDVGMATVYRVLMQFVSAGILLRSQFESSTAVFELNQGAHHDHLVCTVCGKMEEFMDIEIERRQEEIARERGFVIKEHSLALYGTCLECTSGRPVVQDKRRLY
jgi:Fur family transcriptional regulator, ferric uptake regulator